MNYIIKILNTIQNECQKLSLLLINTIGKKIEFPSHRKDWKKFELYNKSIALNVLYVSHNSEKMALSCYKKLSAIFRLIRSNHNGDFYCINCLHSFRSENKLKNHKNVCENYDYFYIEMPKENCKYLRFVYTMFI